ncbi:MAG: GDSL-type esterase/lipase family protein [Pseudomonadota bacterium]
MIPLLITAGLLAALASPAAQAADLTLLAHGRPAPGFTLSVFDLDQQAAYAGAPLRVPRPSNPQAPAPLVQARPAAQALQLTWLDSWHAGVRLVSAQPLDLSAHLAQGTVEFEWRSPDLAKAGLSVGMTCGPDCGRKVNLVAASRAQAGHGWQRTALALRCFVREGADFRQIAQPFALETSGTGELELRRVTLRQRGTPTTTCPDATTQSVSAGPLEEVWSMDWWMPRHEKKLAEIAQRRQAKERIGLVFIGDSITQGWENEGQAIWARHYAKHHALNLGYGGDRTENVLWRLQHGELDGLAPKAVVMMIGTNNTGDRREDPRTTAAGVRRLLAEVQQRLPGTPVLLLAVFPRDPQPGTPLRRINDQLNRQIAGFADGKAVHFLDIGRALMNADGTLSPDVMPDWLHLSEKGYAAWAEAMAPTLDKLMATQP